MSKSTIVDTRIRIRPTKALLKLFTEYKDTLNELPENVAKVLKNNNQSVPSKIEIVNNASFKQPKIDLKLLRSLNGEYKPARHNEEDDTTADSNEYNNDDEDVKTSGFKSEYLYLSDLRWLNEWLAKLRKEKGIDVYLNNLLEKSELELPVNSITKRNAELEARCQRLREEQQNREYLNMTKNVDAQLKYVPEDTIAYQMKAVNSQMIAVLQFVLSVAAGFVFGFLGLELIYGGLDFGLRLILGILCALVIGVAEIYFLAKKINDYDNAISSLKKSTTPVKKAKKSHTE